MFGTFLGSVKTWLMINFKFIAINGLSHLFAGMFVSTVLYPFLSLDYRKRFNYFLLVFFPALVGSIFPDLLFAISTFLRSDSFTSWSSLLHHGGSIHSAFHQDIALILVVPTTAFLILVIVKLVNFVSKYWSKLPRLRLDDLPKHWLLCSSLIAFGCAVLHLLMDIVGF